MSNPYRVYIGPCVCLSEGMTYRQARTILQRLGEDDETLLLIGCGLRSEDFYLLPNYGIGRQSLFSRDDDYDAVRVMIDCQAEIEALSQRVQERLQLQEDEGYFTWAILPHFDL